MSISILSFVLIGIEPRAMDKGTGVFGFNLQLNSEKNVAKASRISNLVNLVPRKENLKLQRINIH